MIKRGLTRNGQLAEIIGISEYTIFNQSEKIMFGIVSGEEVHWNKYGRVKTNELLLLDQNQLDIVKWEENGSGIYYFTKAQLDAM